MINFIQKLKLNYLIWKCGRSHRKWLKAENEMQKAKIKFDKIKNF